MTSNMIEALSERENEVLQAMAEGLTNQEIANSLYIALATVKWYNTQIYSKLGVNNRQEAVSRAETLGLLNYDESDISSIAHNLPQDSTPFIGRYEDLHELNELLHQSDVRLVTILAQGGMGKTRLALRLAQHNLHNFENGVYLIQLASVLSETAVPMALAHVLGIQHYEDMTDIRASVLKYLQTQEMLLFFDNFEHLLDASSLLSDVLQNAPQVKILVTSRERLNLRGEHVYVLSGMATPINDSENALDYDSIQLFIQSAQRVKTDYQLVDDDLPHVNNICRLVDGLPLGIELAAGWVDTLTPEKIALELQKNLDILETDLRDVPERHRSIQAAFEHTWKTLDEQERETMMCLSVFRAGFTQEAAEAVAHTNIRKLKRLVNKSLLYHDLSGRYTIHELLRQYCATRLENSNANDETMERFVAYFADFAKVRLKLMNNLDGTAFRAIRYDWDNLVVAWDAMLASEHFDYIQDSYQSIWKFSAFQGYTYECIRLFDSLIELLRPNIHDDSELLQLFAHILVLQTDLKSGIQDFKEIRVELDEAISILEGLPPSIHLLHAYLTQALLIFTDDIEIGVALARKTLAIATELKAYDFIIYARKGLWAWAEINQDNIAYQEHLQAAYEVWLKHDISQEIGPVFDTVAEMLIRLEQFEQAEALLNAELVRCERAEWLFGMSHARTRLAKLAYQVGRMDEIGQHIVATIRWHERCGRDWQLLGALGISTTSVKVASRNAEGFELEFGIEKQSLEAVVAVATKTMSSGIPSTSWERVR